MNCIEFEAVLQRGLDTGDGLDAPELSEHAAQCPACRGLLEEFRTLGDAIVAWRVQLPEVNLAEAVVTAYSRETASIPQTELPRSLEASVSIVLPLPAAVSRKAVSRSRKSLMAALAGLAAMVVVTWSFPIGPDGEQIGPGTQLAGMELTTLFRSAGTAWLDLAQRAASDLEDAAVLVMPATPTEMAPTGDGNSTRSTWKDGLDSVRPIGESMGTAFGFLLNSEET